jgi:O-antigen/teichoic acid export membrane protein
VSSGRYFIKYFLGLEANGIYAVSIRFTMVLQTLSIVFYQTWQETSIIQYDSKDRDTFFSKVFYDFFYLMCLLLVAFVFLLKINYSWLVNDTYSDSIKYIYPLSIAAVLNAMSSSYFELGYQCSKDTKRAIPGIILVFFVNLLLGIYMTPRYGIWGVAFASVISYLILDIYRFFDTRRYFRINYSSSFIFPTIILLVSFIPFYHTTHLWQDLVYLVIVLSTMLYFAPQDIKKIVGTIFNKLSRQKSS